MPIVEVFNPVDNTTIYGIVDDTISGGKLHPNKFFATEEEAKEGQLDIAKYTLDKINEYYSQSGKGRKPHRLENMRTEMEKIIRGGE